MRSRVREMRETRGMRQEDLAQSVGVSRQTIISIERGRYDPSLKLARKLALLFGTTIEELFVFDEEEER